jgi:hypothetical protein
MDAVRILLVAMPGQPREAYLRQLQQLGVAYDVVDSVDMLEALLQDTPYNGLLLDVPSMIRATPAQKAKLRSLLEQYPVLRLTYRAPEDEIHGLTDGQTSPLPRSIEEFASQECRRTPARALRAFKRCSLVLNVLLLDRPDQPLAEGKKAYTVNVSETGCFVASLDPPECGHTLYAVLCDLFDHTPVPIEVRWQIRWGESLRAPGFGAKFGSLTEAQKAELSTKLALARNQPEND